MSKLLEDFRPIFGEAKVKGSTLDLSPLGQFLFLVRSPDSSSLTFHVSDFYSTWEAVKSISQLEDLRSDSGIGGSLSEFIDYIVASLKFGDVKLDLEGQSELNGAQSANLVAQKSKGMPMIKISLNKLISPDANAAMSNLALKLFETLRSTQDSLVKEQKRSCHLTELLSVEQEKNESLQSQLYSPLYSKRQKVQNAPDDSNNSSPQKSSDYLSFTASQNPSGKLANQDVASTKTHNRVVPAYRRTKVRGAMLRDVEDGDS